MLVMEEKTPGPLVNMEQRKRKSYFKLQKNLSKLINADPKDESILE